MTAAELRRAVEHDLFVLMEARHPEIVDRLVARRRREAMVEPCGRCREIEASHRGGRDGKGGSRG